MGFGCIENREDVNVMNYEKEYAKKLTTPEEAVKIVKSGDWVDYGWCANHPACWIRPWLNG